MASNTDAWLKRAKAVLAKGGSSGESVAFAASILAALYGPHSAQLSAFNSRMKEISGLKSNTPYLQVAHALSTIESVVGEIENGLIVDMRAQVAGEVMSELVGLGKEFLADNAESAKNVSAVLIAAAFEDLMRRMGSELAGVAGRPKLDELRFVKGTKDREMVVAA
jgi:CheY-specific phosphatase CheX